MYERKHVAFSLMSLANFTYDDVLQSHPLPANDKMSFFFVAE
jgi:hypothetical protein